jgi:hypothetical protein
VLQAGDLPADQAQALRRQLVDLELRISMRLERINKG